MSRARAPRDPESLGSRLGSKAVVRAARRAPAEARPPSRVASPPKRNRPQARRVDGRAAARVRPRVTVAQALGRVGSAVAVLARPLVGLLVLPGLLARRLAAMTWGLARRPSPGGGGSGPTRGRLPEPPSSRPRIRVVLIAMAMLAAVVWTRAARLQLDRPGYGAVDPFRRPTLRVISGRRGRILDRHGAELANTVDTESVYALRDQIEDPRSTARRLAAWLRTPEAELRERLTEGRTFAFLARRVSPGVARAVREARLPGIGVELEPRRAYGNVELAAHVLGHVDVEGRGQAGVERVFQDVLQGRTTQVPSATDAKGKPIWVDGYGGERALAGGDVVLTIDRHVQFAAEDVLARTVREHGARAGVAIVLDARTSEILALAVNPTFNPNNLSDSTREERQNRAIEVIHDPGSTAKIVTIAAALEAGLVSPETLVDCGDGEWRVGQRTVRDAGHRFGVLTVREVMARSSNIGAGKIGQMLGADALHRAFVDFGFGARTGIELPGEVAGLLRPAATWREIDLVNIAFGQGVSATPLQIASAANVIAARGVWRAPTLVRGAPRSGDAAAPARRERTVISPATAEAVTRMMTEVTGESGTAPKAAVPGFQVAGKTGTAQKYDPELGAYSREKYVASFVGFLPAEAPEVTLLVLVDEPKGEIYGGAIAGPAFRDIAIAALASRDLYPSEAIPEGKPTAELDEEALSPRARALLERRAAASPGAEAAPRARPRMPDLVGLDGAAAAARCEALGLEPEIRGTGRVARQDPRAGRTVGPGARCTLELKRGG